MACGVLVDGYPNAMKPPRLSERASILSARQKLKMAASAQAYVRGSTVKFYQWLESAVKGSLPEGPPVWICGDCHAGNLGPVADAKGRVEIQIRDFDQTVIGNPAHDLIRLGLSLATAARGSDLPGVTTAKIVEQMIEGYGQALAKQHDDAIKQPKSVRFVMKRAIARTWKHLAEERIEDTKPAIPLGEKFWPLARTEMSEIKRLFKREGARKLATMLRSRDDDARVDVVDAAFWMKGCSSLGRLRIAVLLSVANGGKGSLCLMDIKEATRAAAPQCRNVSMPRNPAARVVEGARHLSPSLGERMLAAQFANRPVFVRELLPQDLKLEIAQLTRVEAMKAATFLAGVVGQAHARQMDVATRQTWQRELRRNRSKSMDAPSWLWSSVVALVASHESAYLEHCRKFALDSDGSLV
jgi:uncharacterized protein (DUF2252 family)